jgi:2-polyprenyl-6-methoxyphenol hydroxylase-like FAD-dependent oxidoreductase
MAGALLARAGVRVLVLEKHGDFLRDFRGDTVHPSTLEVLSELGWLDDFLKLPHQELRRIHAHIGDEEFSIADFSHSHTQCKFIALMPQWDFLAFLVARARGFPGFDIWMDAMGEELVEAGGRFRGIRGQRQGVPFEVDADLVLATDGRHSVLRDQAGLRVRDLGAPIDVLWFRLTRRDTDATQGLGWLRSGRFVVLIDRGAYWQIGYVIRKGGFETIKHDGIDALRRDLVATVPFLGDRVEELASIEDVKMLSVKVDRLDRWWRPGLLFIGDAAHAMSPVGGVGINLAIQDAVAVANQLAKPLARGTLEDGHLAGVQRRRELPARATQAVQRLVQERVIERVLRDEESLHAGALLHVLNRIPFLQRLPAHLVGEGVRPEHVSQARIACQARMRMNGSTTNMRAPGGWNCTRIP